MGARAYRHLSLYTPSPGCLVEIGSERGEGSTRWLADYATRHRLRFYTADIDPGVHRNAKEITDGARLCSGVELLRRVRSPVSVAYMDGFDWTPPGCEDERWIVDQRRSYRHLGVDLTNEACELEHLAEAQLVATKASTRCAVICDDTWHADGRWVGKGALAVPHLLTQGFRVMDHAGCEEHSLGYAVLSRA